MILFYAIKPGFYQTLQLHSGLLSHVLSLSKAQQECMLINIDKSEVTKSATTFFHSAIYENGDELLLDMQVAQRKCVVKDGIVELDNKKNPFYELLCRKYPLHIDQEYE